MKYNLEKFDKVINDIIASPNNNWINNMTKPTFYDLLKMESEQFKKEIKSTIFKLKSNNKIEHYVHKQQLALENLICVVVREIKPERRKDLYKINIEFSKNEQ